MTNLGHIDASLVTDKGQVHSHNEDFVYARTPKDAQDESQNGWLFLVADGVGGAEAGEIASRYATEQVAHHFLANHTEPDWGKRLRGALRTANQDLRALAASKGEFTRMATTMVAIVIHDQQASIVNVGDSRGYYLGQGRLRQITKDHSLVAKLLEEGVITEEEAENYPRKNVILFSLGSEHEPQIDLFTLSLQPGDVLLLCSDGLTRHMSDAEIAEELGNMDAAAVAKNLVAMANARGGEDNISVAAIRFYPDAAGAKGKRRHTAKFWSVSDLFLWLYTGMLAALQTAAIAWIWFTLNA